MRLLIYEWFSGGGLVGSPMASSLAREGNAMRRALVDDFQCLLDVEVLTTLDGRLSDEPPGCETHFVGPGRDPHDVVARLASQAEYTVVVAPETGGVLERLLRVVDSVGGRSLGSAPESVALTSDKLRLAEHLRLAGVDTPPSERFEAAPEVSPSIAYPLVFKPIDGAGSVDTWVWTGPDDQPGREGVSRPMMLQPFFQGESLSLSALVGLDGDVVPLGLGSQCLEIEKGRITYNGGRLPVVAAVDWGPAAQALRSVRGLRGFVGVDLVRDARDGRIHVIEINPRVTTSYIGWREVFGPGRIAQTWMRLLGVRNRFGEPGPRTLPAPSARVVSFDPDGRVSRQGGPSA